MPVRSDFIALESTLGAVSFPGVSSTQGWSFAVGPAAITVTELLVWDQFGNGLVAAHDTAIWTAGGALVVQGTVPAGSGPSVTDGYGAVWRSVDVPDTLLTPGNYVIGSLYGPSDDRDFFFGTATTGPNITHIQGLYTTGLALTLPSSPFGMNDSSFGPNFMAVVPEPGSVALMAIGAAGLALYRRKRKM